MYLKKLSLVNFKNYPSFELVFCPRINCIVGDNGVGKTNLLDAIYYLSLCKSYFNSIDTQNIMHNEELFVIQGEYERLEEMENIYCGVKRNAKKQFKRNKKEYTKLSDHIGLLPIVMISPYDGELVTGGSEERRRFINGVISQYDKSYLEDLIAYNRALTQRNAALKEAARKRSFDTELIELWNEQLIPPGERIYKARVDFIEKLMPIFQSNYELVSMGREKTLLAYESQLHQSSYEELLKCSLEKDRILQFTTQGIHKDDLILNLGEHLIRKTGSQGQQKTYLISLKLAQFDFMRNINGFKPILLFDDLFDKLDRSRVKQLLSLVAENHFGQIFITDTNRERLESVLEEVPIEHQFYTIKNDNISLS
jgi:DNA replication and repair protein RecF